jgi:hypothetical protein
MRAIAGIVVGLIVSVIIAVLAGVVALLATFSIPPGINAADPNQIVHAFRDMPLATQLALAAAWLGSALAGAFVARLIARRAWPAWAVALVVAGYFGLNAFILAQPAWVEALWIIAPLLGGLIGNRLGSGRAAAEANFVEAGDGPAAATIEAEAPPANP